MNKHIKTISIIFISLLFIQCSDNKFVIKKNGVGKISNETMVSEIDIIFDKDSIIKHLSEGDLGGEDTKYLQENDEYLIYAKGGKHLLTIIPKKSHDSTSTIKYVEIINLEYKEEKGLSLAMPFSEINTNYRINKIETSLSSATLYIDELNATIAIDKSDIGVNQFNTDNVTIEQIPDLAKIKNLTLWFD